MAPEVCLGVDAGSVDGSRSRLVATLPGDAVVLDAGGVGFGRAVGAALGHLLADRGDDGTTQWLWLLHDDSAPRPDALARLLDAVEKAPSVAIAGCKQVDAERTDRLVDVGLTMTRTGHRFNRVGSDEVDQGQFDSVTDSLGVNSAGLLIRRDVLEELGGFDPALPGIGDDVDLGRRAWLAGHRVIVVPDAVIEHRSDVVEAVAGPRAERRAAAYTRLKFASGGAFVLLALWMLVAGVGRALGRLVAKDPHGAVVDLGAGATAFSRPRQVAAGRRATARHRTVPRGVVKALLAKPSQVREVRRTLREERLLEGARDDRAAAPEEATGGDDSFEAMESGAGHAGSATSGLIAVLVSAALSLLGLYRLFDAPAIAGGSLLAPGTALGDLWHRATSGWQPVGTGVAGPPDPFDLLVWLSGVISFGHAQIAAVALYMLAMPLATLTAWLCLGAVTRRIGFRFLGAVLFALAPTLQVALAQGRSGSIVVHVVAPLFLLALIRAVGASMTDAPSGAVPGAGGTPSWAAAASASLLGAVLVCAEPLLVVLLLVGAVIAAAISRRARNLWWLPVPGLLIALPLLVRAVSDPRVLLVQPGVPQAADAAPVWQQLLGWPVTVDTGAAVPGLPALGAGWPLWIALLAFTVPVGLMALCAIVSPGRGTTTARVGLLLGLLALVGGVAASRLDATVSGEAVVAPFTGSFISFFLLGVLLAAGVQAQRLLGRPGRARGAARRWGWGVAGTLMIASVLACAVVWAAPRVIPGELEADALGTAQQVKSTAVSPLPATAADRGEGAYAERSLVLAVAEDGRITATLASGDGVRIEDLSSDAAARRLQGDVFRPSTTSRAQADAGSEAVRQAVASLSSGESTDNRDELADLGVSSVVLQSGDTGADVLARQLDAQPALAAVGRASDDSAWIWRVQSGKDSDDAVTATGSPTARVRVVSDDGATLSLVAADDADASVDRADIASGPEGRTLVLAESADAGWHATINGKELTAASNGWAQAFELPSGGGSLRVWYSHGWYTAWLVLLGLGLLVALLSIIPVPRAWRADARAARTYRPGVAERTAAPDEGTATAAQEDHE